MAEVLSYATPTTDGRELLRYQAWQRRLELARKVRWCWLGVVGAGFVLATLLALGGREYDEVRGYIIVLELLLGAPVYIVIVTLGACGKIWPILFAVACGTAACFFALGAFIMLQDRQSGTALMLGLVSVFFMFLWSMLAIEFGRLPLPRVETDGRP